jgi:class 3 adenylate cyclase/tetratricopeptide (TPR) repeat protein
VSDPTPKPNIEALLDRAFKAISDGDRVTAAMLANQVLVVDHTNSDAEDLLAAPADHGEIRRLTVLFADLVDSTVLSTRIDPESYRLVVGRYRDSVLQIVQRFEGHVGNPQGDGIMAMFGHPHAHENDVRRAVQAGLEITREVARLSEQAQRRFGIEINVRVGVHRGAVYLDTAQGDVYGLAANFVARVSSLAPPGSVVVSDAIEGLLRRHYDLEALPPRAVKGIEGLVEHHRVVGENSYRPGVPRGPFVGRRDELSRLQTLWQQAESGTSKISAVGLTGEAGLGKSRLAGEVVELAERSGASVLTLVGSPFHTDAGLHPVRTLLERHCGITRQTAQVERLRLLESEIRSRTLDPEVMIPLIAPAMGIAAGTGYQRAESDGRKLYQRIADAVRDYLLACVGTGPGLIVAEDMQWFDPSSVDVLRALLAVDAPGPLIVMTGRDDAQLPSGIEVLKLAPLSSVECDELIHAIEPSLTEADRAEVRGRCDGVPLYLEEVATKHAQQQSNSSEWTRVPDALYEPLFARLRASAHAVPLAVAAAAIGRDVDRGMLLSVATLPEDEVDTVIDELEAAGVFEPAGTDLWRFRHELLREVAAELAPPTQRRELHGRVGDALVSNSASGQPDWREVALHYGHAGRFDEAATACLEASADARRRGALSEARDYLTRAIDHIDGLPPGTARDRREIAARLRRGFLISAAEGTTSAVATSDFERCLELIGAELSDEMFATLTALYSYYLTRSDIDRAEQLLESVRVGLGTDRKWFRPVNDSGFGQVAWFRGDFDTARRRLEAAAAVGTEVGLRELERNWFTPHEPIASLYANLALARFIQGDYAGTEAAFADAEQRCQQLGFPHGPFSLAFGQSMEVWVRAEADQLDRAAKVHADMVANAEHHGFDAWLLIGAAQKATIDARVTLAAEPVNHEAVQANIGALAGLVQMLRAVELAAYITVFETVSAMLYLAIGDRDRARKRIEAALKHADTTKMTFYKAELLRYRAAASADATSRDADLSAALELARSQGATIFELRAATDAFQLYGERARATLIDAVARFPADSSWPQLAQARTLLG